MLSEQKKACWLPVYLCDDEQVRAKFQDTEDTEDMKRFLNKVFDILNGRHKDQSIRKGDDWTEKKVTTL